MRARYLLAAVLIVGVMIGAGIVLFAEPQQTEYILVPVDYNPFLPPGFDI